MAHQVSKMGSTSSKPWYVASELKDGSNPQELDQEHISLVVEYDIEGRGTSNQQHHTLMMM